MKQTMVGTGTVNSLFLQTSQDYPLSHRCMPTNKVQSTMNSVITPKSFVKTTALKTARKEENGIDTDDLSPHQQKQIMSSTYQTTNMKPMLSQINNGLQHTANKQ